MLTSDANYSLVILIWYMKRNRGWHLLFDEVKTVLRCFVLCATDIDIEVVFIEAVEYDLYIT